MITINNAEYLYVFLLDINFLTNFSALIFIRHYLRNVKFDISQTSFMPRSNAYIIPK